MTDLMRPAAAPAPQAACGAKLKTRPGELCPQPPMKGQKRCRMHGGAAKQNRAAGERRQAEARALTIVARYGVPADVEWHQAMQEALNQAYGDMLALRDLVQRLEPEALTWGTQQVVTVGATQFPGIDSTKAARVAPLVELYERSLDRLFRMGNDCGKLGLEAQRNLIAERDGVRLADAGQTFIAEAIRTLGLDQAAAAPVMQRLFAEMLRSLAGGPLQVTA